MIRSFSRFALKNCALLMSAGLLFTTSVFAAGTGACAKQMIDQVNWDDLTSSLPTQHSCNSCCGDLYALEDTHVAQNRRMEDACEKSCKAAVEKFVRSAKFGKILKANPQMVDFGSTAGTLSPDKQATLLLAAKVWGMTRMTGTPVRGRKGGKPESKPVGAPISIHDDEDLPQQSTSEQP